MKLNEYEKLMSEACDKLRIAQEENARLRKALVRIMEFGDDDDPEYQIASAALSVSSQAGSRL